MRTSKRHQGRGIREEGCRTAARTVEEQRRRTAAAAALRRMHPLG
jgi:hypothetical protein